MRSLFTKKLTERQKQFDELVSAATMPRREWSPQWEPRLDWGLVYEIIGKINEGRLIILSIYIFVCVGNSWLENRVTPGDGRSAFASGFRSQTDRRKHTLSLSLSLS
eukprot:TRINITY_DN10388_c0_g1_i1.p2 TRINITY_DN10388_c0_g1~~TRINITY_DN10388_c0_g1_i1.p2  ORF type:complete len:107 (-),score=3.23 TRINITY_DN10388_c0_g1_i1:129-449(-)